MAKYAPLIISCLLAIGATLVTDAPAAETSLDKRLKLAESGLAPFINGNLQLNDDQFLLFSFEPALTPSDLLIKSSADGITASAVHVCRPGGGVTAFFVDPKIPLGAELNRIKTEAYPEAKNRMAHREPLPAPHAEKLRIQDERWRKMPEEIAYCGLEARMNASVFIEFRARLGRSLRAVEISNTRMRLLPINTAK